MNKIKRIICILLTLCFTVAFTSCGYETPQENTTTTQNSENVAKEEITVLSLNKDYVSHYEWYEDYPKMLVRSEYSSVTLDKSLEKKYSALAETLSETSVMRKRTMEDEKDNLLADATKEFMNDGEAFSTHVSTLDVHVRRADSIAVSILEDYNSDYGRAMSGLNYDTESGNIIALSDVVTDISKIPGIVEKEVTSRMWQGEFNEETSIPDYFENTPEEDINWVLDYNGVTFYFNPGAIAPTNFGIQTATVTFAEYPGLFNEKYSVAPNAYIVSLPVSSPYFADINSDKRAEEIIVSGNYDSEELYYTTLGIYSEKSSYEEEWFAYGLDPYYVKTADGNSYIYVFSLNNEGESRETVLTVFGLKNGEVQYLGTSQIGMLGRGDNVYVLPTNPDNLLLYTYDGETDSVYSADENGVPMKTVEVGSVQELLNSISSNTEIVIKKGYYNLSDYFESLNDSFTRNHISFDECFDGMEIFVNDVSFLKISGASDNYSDTELVVTPRHAAVFNFDNCNNIEISNLTVGHTDTGDCSGNVLNFSDCSDITINNSDLYGCGVYGIGTNNGTGYLYVNDSVIRDCSYGPMDIVEADGVFEFTNCTLTGSEGFGNFEKTDDCTLIFRNCTFGYRETSYFMFLEDITTENCTWSEDYIYPEYGY